MRHAFFAVNMFPARLQPKMYLLIQEGDISGCTRHLIKLAFNAT